MHAELCPGTDRRPMETQSTVLSCGKEQKERVEVLEVVLVHII